MLEADDIVGEFRGNNENIVSFFDDEKLNKILKYSLGLFGKEQTAKQAGSCANI